MRIYIKSMLGLAFIILLMATSANAQYRRYHGYGRGYYPRIGTRIFLNNPGYGIFYGGYRYHFFNGIFYRPYGSFFRVVFPPIGIHIGVLPYGYSKIYLDGYPYYYYNGIFYRPWDEGGYEVVAPPIGAEVAELPEGARPVVIDHKRYYEFNGTYFKETIKNNGEIWYIVSGKNGDLENDSEITEKEQGISKDQEPQSKSPESYSQSEPPLNHKPGIGMEVSALPDGSKTLVINNQKYFVSPDDIYYQELIEHNEIYYRVVPKPVQ